MAGLRLAVGGYTKDAPGGGPPPGQAPPPARIAELAPDGTLRDRGGFDAGVNPSWIAVHPEASVVYACSEDFTAGVEGSITAWSQAGPAPRPVGVARTGGHAPCHVGVASSDAGLALVVAHYVGGQVSVVPLDGDGHPASDPSDVVQHVGASAAVADRQEAPHPHQALWDRAAALVWVCDLGQDRVVGYRLRSGQLSQAAELAVPPGFGPRHVAFHPSLGAMALVGELANEVMLFRRGERPADWREVDRRPTLPGGFSGASGAAAILWDATGQRLYATNRGHDSVAVWRLRSEGTLAPVGHSPVGAAPRDLALTSDGRWALVAAQGEHRVTAHPVAADGLLGPAASDLTCAFPARVALLRS
ncbi:MAG: lactonase family protein [Propionibacteriaceae bacterium]|jgi:6-phosphogluconolactonase|nr:lactonase family protein [Propionibacteriaceae bacterium]